MSMEFDKNRQLREIPAQLPLFVRSRTALVVAVSEDQAYSAKERISTLIHLADRFFGHHVHNGEKDPILASVMAHRVARLVFQLSAQAQEEVFQATRRGDNPVARFLMPYIREQMPRLASIELANCVWAASVLRVDDPTLWEVAAERTKKVAYSLTAHGLANVAWAFTKQATNCPELFESLGQQTLEVVRGSRAQVLSTLALAFSKARLERPDVFRALGDEFIRRLSEASTKNIANVLMALGTSNLAHVQLFNRAASELLNRSDELNSRDIASCYWAIAKMGVWREDLFDFFSSQICTKLRQFSAHDLCTVAWSVGMTKRQDPHLFREIGNALIPKVRECSFVGLSNVANAFADCSIRDDELMQSVVNEVLARGPSGFKDELGSIAWSMATLGVPHDAFFTMLAEDTAQNAAQLEPRHLVIRTWALAFGKPELVATVCPREKLDTFVDEGDWMQVYEAFLAVGLMGPHDDQPRLREVEKSNRIPPLTEFELGVERELLTSGFAADEIRRLPVIAGKYASFLITRDNTRVAIRCLKDRKHRALGPDGQCLMGRDIIQERAWAQCGVRTAHLFESEYRLGGAQELRRRLDGIF